MTFFAMKRLAFFDTKPYDRESFDRLNAGRYEIRYFETRLTAAALPLADGCDTACAFVNAEIDRAVVEGLVARGIKVLAMRCAGYNNVDFKAAYESGLTVVRVPAYSPYAVAEHAAALLLALNRHIHRAASRTRDFNFSLSGLTGFDLHGKTAGIVGTDNNINKIHNFFNSEENDKLVRNKINENSVNSSRGKSLMNNNIFQDTNPTQFNSTRTTKKMK